MFSKPLHILIAEDDEDDMELISSSFKKSSSFYKIDTVKDGVELMDYLHTNRKQLPDVILTDLNMPKKDGYESLQEICSDADFNRVPVFVYSTTLNPLYILKCKNLGAVDFVLKPFKLAEIEAIPERICVSLSKTVSAN
jgi:CheY-like chemotaxis protein